MRVIVIPVLSDNYSYLIIDEASKCAAAVDPVEPEKILRIAHERGVSITQILTTHHHWDHAGGNEEMKMRVPGVEVFGGALEPVQAKTRGLDHVEEFALGTNTKITALHTPGHTKGHICYFVQPEHTKDEEEVSPAVFTGDTLFIGGCGKFFEGSPSQMYVSLCQTLKSLPPNTKVYCGHEYTIKNLEFALTIEPENDAIRQKLAHSKQKLMNVSLNKNDENGSEKRESNSPFTVPSTIQEELMYNPFMRVDNESIQRAVGKKSPIDAIAEIRRLKNCF